jgi:hypothetical protein
MRVIGNRHRGPQQCSATVKVFVATVQCHEIAGETGNHQQERVSSRQMPLFTQPSTKNWPLPSSVSAESF